MNDYKELIDKFREIEQYGDGHDDRFIGVLIDLNAAKDAADAIEQLVRERDTAIADLTNIVHDMGNTCICDYCIGCVSNGFREGCKTDDGDRWEWRGVQEVDHEY